jgi:hypothetical protein
LSEPIQHELCILTNDGWVISLLADKAMSLGDAVVSSVIVQPREDYDKGLGVRGVRQRRTYRLNVQGRVVYSSENIK